MKKVLFILCSFFAFISISISQQSVQSAIDNMDTRFIKEWTDAGHDINNLMIVNDQKITPLSYASLKAQPEMVKLLLKKGAQVNLKVEFQDALMYAAMGGNVEVIELLLNSGANPMNENKMGKCARDLAKDNGNIEAHRLLVIETDKRLQALRSQKRK
jgi:ankyrin repeat protein